MTSGAELTRRPPARRFVTCILAAGLAATLAGCVETMGNVEAGAQTPSAAASARPLGSPRAATASFTSLEGAPPAVLERFIQRLAAETKRRDITPVQPDVAKYVVQGYLSATRTQGGVTLGYVWDVFDTRKTRVQRIEDRITAPGAAVDPWSLADDRALDSLAAKSADDLAALLASMPEAAGEAGLSPPAGAVQAPQASLASTSALR